MVLLNYDNMGQAVDDMLADFGGLLSAIGLWCPVNHTGSSLVDRFRWIKKKKRKTKRGDDENKEDEEVEKEPEEEEKDEEEEEKEGRWRRNK